MKKTISILSILLLLNMSVVVPQSYANPLVLVPLGAVVVGTCICTYAGIRLYRPSSIPSGFGLGAITTAGLNIGRAALGAANQLSDYGQQTLMGKTVTLRQSAADMASRLAALTAAQLKADYPGLSAIMLDGLAGPPVLNKLVGDLINVPGYGVRQITGVTMGTSGNSNSCANIVEGHATMCKVFGAAGSGYDSNHCLNMQYSYADQTAVEAPAPKSTQALRTSLPASYPQGVCDELDKMIAAEIANGSTGTLSVIDTVDPNNVDQLPPATYTPPKPVVNPDNPTVTGLSSANAGATQAGATSAAGASTAAGTARDAYATAHPGSTAANDPDYAALIKAALDADHAARAAQRAADAADAANKEVYQNPDAEALRTIDFTPFLGIGSAFAAVYPFSLLSSLGGYISMLVAPPVAPTFDLPLPLGNSVHVDLASFDVAAALCRWVMGLLLTFGTVFYIVRFWRGVA